MRISTSSSPPVTVVPVLVQRGDLPLCSDDCFIAAKAYYGCDSWPLDLKCCWADNWGRYMYSCINSACSIDEASQVAKFLHTGCSSVAAKARTQTSSTSTTSRSQQTTLDVLTSTLPPRSTSTTSSPSSRWPLSLPSLSGSSFQAQSTSTSSSPTLTPSPISSTKPEPSLTPAIKGTISASIIVAVILVAVLLLCLQRFSRRNKYADVVTNPQDSEPKSPSPAEDPNMAHELYGKAVIRSSGDFAELEAIPATAPILDECGTPGAPDPVTGPGTLRTLGLQTAGQFDCDRDSFVGSVQKHQRGDSLILENLGPPFNFKSLSQEAQSPSQRQSLSETTAEAQNIPDESHESNEMDALLSDLALVEQRRKDRASQLLTLQKEEMAIRAEEAELLEQIRKRASRMPDGANSPKNRADPQPPQ